MNLLKVKPYSDFLSIRPLEKKSIIAQSQARIQEVGEVIEIGPEVKNTKVGDYVAFEKWDKPEFTYEDTTFHLIREKDAVCKLILS